MCSIVSVVEPRGGFGFFPRISKGQAGCASFLLRNFLLSIGVVLSIGLAYALHIYE